MNRLYIEHRLPFINHPREMNKTKAFLATLLACLLASCSSDVYVYTSFHEPANEGLRYLWSSDGIHWDSIPGTWLKPEIGKQRVMRDPSIVRTPDGTFHLAWTCSWKGDRGFGYASSRDLMHWSPERFIPVMSDTTTVNVWAPEFFYDKKRKETMVVWASCIPGKFPDGQEDHYNNHRLYYSTTRDFRTFSPARLLIDPGFSSIDATLLSTGNDKYVMVLKDNTRPSRNLRISFADDPHGPWGPASATFTDMYCEGPAVAKTKRGYIVYYDRYRKKDFGASLTQDFKTFEDISSQVSVPEGHKHGTIFRAPKSMVKKLLKAAAHPQSSTR
jgi:hypothetical protein